MHQRNRKSIRLKRYDYSQSGWYFITICTQNRKPIFGDIIDEEMALTEFGIIVKSEWEKTADIRNNINIDEFIIMPNHLHGIIGIIDDEYDLSKGTKEVRASSYSGKGTMHRAPTTEQFGKPTSNSIPTIIRGFKSSVTKRINQIRNTPGAPVWQRNYYERIIGYESELNRIRKYIIENPIKQHYDKYYSKNHLNDKLTKLKIV